MSSLAVAATTGFSWGTAFLAMINLLLGGVLVAVIKSRPVLKRLANEREKSLLEERANDMETMRVRLEKLEAERSVDRHRLNNVTACLDALLLLLETAPDKAAQHVARIKAMREAQMKAEAVEKGAIHAQSIERAEMKL